MALITITLEQRKVVDEALRLEIIVSERQALEIGLATVREQVKERVAAERAAQEEKEQAERERIAANQFSLFGDPSEF